MARRKIYILIASIIIIGALVSGILFYLSLPNPWLQNAKFKNSDNWVFETRGDDSDVNGSIEDGYARLSILGESGFKNFFENGEGWIIRNNEDGITPPEDYNITESGWWASHDWNDFTPQLLKVQWQKNFTMDVNMSDYKITSASFETWINATVVALDANGGGLDCVNDTSEILDMGNGDYIKYFVLISDLAREREFELTSFQTKSLGCDAGNITTLNDTRIIPLSEDTLKFYLEEVLKYDFFNFTITLGILLWCEDNYNSQDMDHFSDIYMKNLSLNISYEKKIDQFTGLALKQIGNEIKGTNLQVKSANLNFDYKINNSGLINSELSEMILEVNNNKYIEKSVRLIDIESSWKNFNPGGVDLTNYIQKNVPISISIEILLKEDFRLNDSTSILIDNVYLYIEIINTAKDWTPITILLSLMIIGAITGFILYNKYFKYPLLVRKIRKLKRKIRKGKKVEKSISLKNRSKLHKSKYRLLIEKLDIEKPNPNNNYENLKKKKKNIGLICFLFLILIINPFFLILNDSKINDHNFQIIETSSEITQEWLKNNHFSNQSNWFGDYGAIGDESILLTNISEGKGNFFVLGEEKNIILTSGVPNNTLTSKGWYNTTNPQIVSKPTRGYKINESGCFASHEWEEYMYNEFEVNARQNTAIQWDKKINIPDDMSKYVIMNATLKFKVNATVTAPSDGNFQDGVNGVDVSLDESTGASAFDIGDYLKFYAIISDPEKHISYRVAEFIPPGLGNDSAGQFDYLNDTIVEPDDLEDFIFYLTQVLKTDNHNFTLTLGMEFYCEDDQATDGDFFNEVYIKECNFSFTYQKLIPQYSSISLNQITDKIPETNIEILDAKVNMTYSSNYTWPQGLSPFSEMRIAINNNSLSRTILLKDFNSTCQNIELNAKPFIVKNKDIYFTIEIFIGNDFNYDKNLSLSIDNVGLFISYRIIESQPQLLPLVIGLGIGFMGLLIVIGAYQLYFKYPPIVRKIRKIKKKIRKNKKLKSYSLKERTNTISEIISKKNKLITPEREEIPEFKKIKN
ncbi:MAG: hypothetical protein EU547_05950 [Promethearchaeota archaeon]|nr:MAG: hypothetical protein EU547_05950 [Candidatus Lokiarchaeota archaeon]